MTEAQFAALAQLLRLRRGPAQEAARLVMTQGMSTPDAARQVGIDYRLASYAAKRVRNGLDLARKATTN